MWALMRADPSISVIRLEGRRRGTGSTSVATVQVLKDASFWRVRASLVGLVRLQEPQPRASVRLPFFKSPSSMSYELSVFAGEGR